MLAVPNVSEGRDAATLDAIAAAFGPGLIHRSSDPVHHRAVFTLTGAAGELHEAVLDGAREAIARIDLNAHEGIHPRVGVLDVAPIVYLDERERGAACAEALVLADELGQLGVPVYLYGELAGGRTRAQLRRDLSPFVPDFGPPSHPTAGATLVAARPPLVAFNVEIDAPLETAQAIARTLRTTLDVRALGLQAEHVQVSTNIENARTMAEVVEAVRAHAPVIGAELVAPAPRAAFAGFPDDVPLRAPKALEDHLLS
jgi:glutamate formiminotransferase